jgi:hypothetical protein
MVNDRLENGRLLVEHLRHSGFEVAAAFWAQLSEEERWFLYLASPVVDRQGQAAAYRTVYTAIQRMPELGIEPFEVRLVGTDDAMAKAAMEAIRPRMASGPFAVPNPKPYPGLTRFGGASLGGVSVDGVYIYPPPAASSS